MELLVEDWQEKPELQGLEGLALLAECGIWPGDIQVWAGDREVWAGSCFSAHEDLAAA